MGFAVHFQNPPKINKTQNKREDRDRKEGRQGMLTLSKSLKGNCSNKRSHVARNFLVGTSAKKMHNSYISMRTQ
jgi:hypothetical protein